MSGAYRANPAKDPNGDDGLPPYVAAPSGHFKGALITHNGDIYGGDGLQDLVVRVGEQAVGLSRATGTVPSTSTSACEILLPDGRAQPRHVHPDRVRG